MRAMGERGVCVCACAQKRDARARIGERCNSGVHKHTHTHTDIVRGGETRRGTREARMGWMQSALQFECLVGVCTLHVCGALNTTISVCSCAGVVVQRGPPVNARAHHTHTHTRTTLVRTPNMCYAHHGMCYSFELVCCCFIFCVPSLRTRAHAL